MILPVQFAASSLVLCLALALQVLLLPGCATLPPPRPVEMPAAEAIGRALLDEWDQGAHPQTLQGLAKVKVTTPERSLSGTQVLLAGTPDRLRAETLSPFGTPLLVMTGNGSELAVLLPGDNLYYLGRASPENLQRFTRLSLRLTDLVNILLFQPPRITYQQLATFHRPEGGWKVVLESGPRRQELHFDVDHRLIEVAYLYQAELQLRLAYGDYEPGAQGLPRRIDLVLPLQKTEASLIFKELEIDRPLAPEVFTLSPPAGATVKLLDELSAAPALEGENRATPGEGSPATQGGRE
jgi:hypothetical protein